MGESQGNTPGEGDAPASHVFIVRGDITHLACDAWLLPTDRYLSIEDGWRSSVRELDLRIIHSDADAVARFRKQEVLAFPLAVASDAYRHEPTPILTAVPLAGVNQADDVRPAVKEFIAIGAVTARASRREETKPWRAVPLLAMPFFGTAGGGGGPRRGNVLKVLLEEARKAAQQEGVDVVLVLRDAHAYALAQQVRKTESEAWPELSPEQLEEASRLAGIAKDGRLVPFMGAGVSISAGAPDWAGLIEQLATEAGLDDAIINRLLDPKLDPLDQAAFLRSVFEERGKNIFVRAVAAAVDLPRYGLAPALLASLDAEQAITLNYDKLFEMAAIDIDMPRRIIPSTSGSSTSHERWLLKLHGTVDDPESIVLTRDDYLGFGRTRAALGSLVTASLLTRHLFFVGFGLNDDHFHEIVHDVRRAIPGSSSPLGTVVTLQDDPLAKRLWSGALEFLPMAKTGNNEPLLLAARRLEIFLDALIAKSADSHSYLLVDSFESELSDDERVLKTFLRNLGAKVPLEARRTEAWGYVQRALKALSGEA